MPQCVPGCPREVTRKNRKLFTIIMPNTPPPVNPNLFGVLVLREWYELTETRRGIQMKHGDREDENSPDRHAGSRETCYSCAGNQKTAQLLQQNPPKRCSANGVCRVEASMTSPRYKIIANSRQRVCYRICSFTRYQKSKQGNNPDRCFHVCW